MTQRSAMLTVGAVLAAGLLLGCSEETIEPRPPAGVQASESSSDPREVVVDFYANAARLDCAAALEAMSFYGENADRLRTEFSSTCQDSSGNDWAEQVVVGSPEPIRNNREIAVLTERVPEATDFTYIPVTENGATEPSDTLMVKVNDEWLIAVN